MNPIQVLAGIIAGAIGAAVWAAISYYANVEVGYVAWGIGFLVGVAVAAAGRNSTLAGINAVLITIVSLLAGKYAAIELSVQDLKGEIESSAAEWDGSTSEITDESLQRLLANQIVRERKAEGEQIVLSNVGEDEEDGSKIFPADIWESAKEQFAEKSIEEKQTLRDEYASVMKERTNQFAEAYLNSIRKEGFLASFGMLDLVFFGLALVTAWGIASREEEDNPESTEEDLQSLT